MKRCFKCKRVKRAALFYRHPRMGDGRLNKCISCTKKDVAAQPYNRAYETDRAKRPERRAAASDYQRARRLRHPGKARARNAISNAIRDGKLKRQPCRDCGAMKAQAHHKDYRRPLVVDWLCFACHRREHGQKVV